MLSILRLLTLLILVMAMGGPVWAEERRSIRPVNDLSGLGMCVHLKHFKAVPEEVERLKAAGMSYVRVDMTWNSIEKEKGIYDWSYYDKALAPIVAAGIRPIFLLGFSNDLYIEANGKHVPPRTPEQIKAFADWAAATAKHFAALNPIMEIWNEADIPTFWNPQPKVEEYLAMAKPVCEAIRQAAPQATILTAGIGNVPVVTNFDSQVFMRVMMADKGLMECVDGVSIHPYRTSGPETLLDVMPFLEQMAEDSALKGGAVRRPYVITELGYSSFLPKDKPRLDEAQKAAYLVRMPIVGLMAKMPLMMIYNWRDYGNNPLEKEDRFGVLDFDSEDKDSVRGLRVLHEQIGDMKLVKRLATAPESFVLEFRANDGQQTLMAWQTKGKVVLEIESAMPVTVVQMLGKRRTYSPEAGRVRLPLDGNPVYVPLGTKELGDITVSPRKD